MTQSSNRRDFIKTSTIGAGGLWLIGSGKMAFSYAANEKLDVACIGVGGRGEGDMMGVAGEKKGKDKNGNATREFVGENIVGLCDIDDNNLDKAHKVFEKAKKFHDFRRMLDNIGKRVDAVVVATPDHTHAVAAAAAIRLGKHVYCEKPLTHSIHEARALKALAAQHKVITQMGNQGHSNDATRKVVEMVRAGVIGNVKEVHAWTDRPIWPQAIDRPTDKPETPKHVHWNLWLGPAPQRAYNPAYHPFKWRGWWDFGTGALGDMACHVLDTAFWALDLRDPTSIEAEAESHKPETAPMSSVIRYDFPARGERPALKFTWYDGGKLPPLDLIPENTFDKKKHDNGSLLVGEKGTMYIPDAYGGNYMLFPSKQFEGYKAPEPTIPRSPGHHKDWVEAIKTGRQACSNFEYACALTETVLLGNVALRAGQKIEWDAKAGKVTNCSQAEEYVRREYRKGWSL